MNFMNLLKECNKSMNDRISRIELKNKEYADILNFGIMNKDSNSIN